MCNIEWRKVKARVKFYSYLGLLRYLGLLPRDKVLPVKWKKICKETIIDLKEVITFIYLT